MKRKMTGKMKIKKSKQKTFRSPGKSKRGIQVKGTWTPVEMDPSLFSEEDMGGLVCFELFEKNPLLGLVLTPTRELAVQVKHHIDAVAKCLVIDEADRMVEKGHFAELSQLLEMLNDTEFNPKRQNFVFSATLTMIHEAPMRILQKKKGKKIDKESKLETLMEKVGIKSKPKIIDLTRKEATVESLTETRIHCDTDEKDFYLYYFLLQYPGRTMVFANSIDCIKRLNALLTILDCTPLPLHANMHQKQRLKNLERFAERETSVLLTTDVAARGLDIPDVQHVIHYQDCTFEQQISNALPVFSGGGQDEYEDRQKQMMMKGMKMHLKHLLSQPVFKNTMKTKYPTQMGKLILPEQPAREETALITVTNQKKKEKKQKTALTCVLLTTDVAARGLDIPDVQHVIHYQVPRTSETYVHRSGRTARATKEGLSLLLIGPDDVMNFRKIYRTLGKDEELPLFPIQTKCMAAIKERVKVARKIEKIEYHSGRAKQHNSWFQKAAEALEIDLDDDVLIGGGQDEYEDRQKQMMMKGMKMHLKHLLSQPVFKNTMKTKYPTQMGKLILPEQPAREETALITVTNQKKKEKKQYK
ncbi:UNVERIFIED_CONTAM: hypothetical protein FKN15_031751 [Acipenser sinensis]